MQARTIRTTFLSLLAFALIGAFSFNVPLNSQGVNGRFGKSKEEREADEQAKREQEASEREKKQAEFEAQAKLPIPAMIFGKTMQGRSQSDLIKLLRALPEPEGRELMAGGMATLDLDNPQAALAAWDKGDDAALLFALTDAGVADGELSRAVQYAMLREVDDSSLRSALASCFDLDAKAVDEALAAPYAEDEKPASYSLKQAPSVKDMEAALVDRDGISLLTLSGTPEEKGYTHGYMLAKEILTLLISASQDPTYLLVAKRSYKQVRELQHTSFEYSEEIMRELWGMKAGIEARLTSEEERTFYGHVLDIVDLKVLNSAADWLYLGCSSITVFSESAGELGPMSARNLDYLRDSGGHVFTKPLVVASKSDEDQQCWLSATWPGMVGHYSSMRKDGVAVFMQDSNARSARRVGLVPRSIAARRVLEECDASDPIESAASLFRAQRTFTGSNFHFIAPDPNNKEEIVAAVFEYDGRSEIDEGVTIRLPGSAEESDNSLVVTNHFCSRTGTYDGGANSSQRFAALDKQLKAYAGADTKVGLDEARTLLQLVEADTQYVLTIHSTYTFPLSGRFYVAFADKKGVSTRRSMVLFSIDDLAP